MVKSTQIKRVLREGEREASLAGGLPSSVGTAWYGVVVKDIARRCQLCIRIPGTTAIRNISIRHSSSNILYTIQYIQVATSAIKIFSSLLPSQLGPQQTELTTLPESNSAAGPLSGFLIIILQGTIQIFGMKSYT